MSSFQSSPYEIERTSGRCAATGRTLEPGEAYIAALLDDGEQLRRLDYSLEAWNEAEPQVEHLFSFWKTTVPQPDEKKKTFVDDEVLLNLLRRLADAEQPQRIAFRFVLMLILMRKKMLRYNRTDKRPVTVTGEDDQPQAIEQEWWLMTPKLDVSKGPMGKWNDDETLEVLDPQLNDEQIRSVTEQLGEILNAEL